MHTWGNSHLVVGYNSCVFGFNLLILCGALKKIFFYNVYLFLRETETECEWIRAEREGGTESESGCRLRAVSTEPDMGLELTSCEIVT